jgi:hypothetical protein
VDERGDGGERVVDEVRGDLRAQRRQLGARQPLALRLHLRQLDHRRHQRGRLADHPGLLEPQTARPVVERHQRADAPVADHERRHDRRSQRAAGVLAVQLRLHPHPVVARLARQLGEGVAGPVVVAAEPVERQQPLGVGEGDRAGAGQHPQMRGGGRRAARAEPAPQMGEQRRGRVHGALHRRARRVDHARRPEQASTRGQRGRERKAQEHTECDVHPRGRE